MGIFADRLLTAMQMPSVLDAAEQDRPGTAAVLGSAVVTANLPGHCDTAAVAQQLLPAAVAWVVQMQPQTKHWTNGQGHPMQRVACAGSVVRAAFGRQGIAESGTAIELAVAAGTLLAWLARAPAAQPPGLSADAASVHAAVVRDCLLAIVSS